MSCGLQALMETVLSRLLWFNLGLCPKVSYRNFIFGHFITHFILKWQIKFHILWFYRILSKAKWQINYVLTENAEIWATVLRPKSMICYVQCYENVIALVCRAVQLSIAWMVDPTLNTLWYACQQIRKLEFTVYRLVIWGGHYLSLGSINIGVWEQHILL